MILSDETLGWKIRANWTGCLYQPDTAKKINITTNSIGLRSTEEFTMKKPDNTFRILVFGDSLLWGAEYSYENTVQVQLKEALESQIKQPVEVLAFAGDGYTLTQHFLSYEEKGYKYNADVVIYLVSQNDLSDIFGTTGTKYPKPLMKVKNNTLDIFTAEQVAEINRKRTGNERLYLLYKNDYNKKRITLPKYKEWLMAKSHFLNFIDQKLRIKPENLSPKRLIEKLSPTNPSLFHNRMKNDHHFSTSVNHFYHVLSVFNEKVSKRNSSFVVVNVPSIYQVKRKYHEILKKEAQKVQKGEKTRLPKDIVSLVKIKPEILTKQEKRNYFLSVFTEANQINYIELTETALKNEKEFYWKIDPHWTPKGVAVSTKHIANELKKKYFSDEPANHKKIDQ